jgi:hypothetical protein
MWLVMSNGAKTGPGSYSGTLYRTTGPAFNSGLDGSRDGHSRGHGIVRLQRRGQRHVQLHRERHRAIQADLTAALLDARADVHLGRGARRRAELQDLWWAAGGSEPGWGVNLTHQGDVLFATWFTYATFGRGQWLVMSNGVRTANGIYTGPLYRTSGPPFDSTPWNPAAVTVAQVGTATFTFSGANDGIFSYSVDGIAGSKAISRMAYAAPPTVCR